MMTPIKTVPYLPEDATLPIDQIFVSLDSIGEQEVLIYMQVNVSVYKTLLESLLLLRNVFKLDKDLEWSVRRKLKTTELRAKQHIREVEVLSYLEGKASAGMLRTMVSRFSWVKTPVGLNHDDFAIDEFWMRGLLQLHDEFFKQPRYKQPRSDDVYGDWLTNATILTNEARLNFIWQSIGKFVPPTELNIFRAYTDSDGLHVDRNYVDDLNRHYDGPPVEELDRMANEAESEAAHDETYALKADSSPSIQNLTVSTQTIVPPAAVNPLDDLRRDLSIVQADVTVTANDVSKIDERLATAEQKINKLLRLNSWLLATWILQAVLIAALLVINLKNFI